MNVTRALRRPLAANAGGTWTRDGEPVRLASRFPSIPNTTRLISTPLTVAVKPAAHAAGGAGFGRVSVARPFRVGTVEWLAGGGALCRPGLVLCRPGLVLCRPGGVVVVEIGRAGGAGVVVGEVVGGVETGGVVVEGPHMEPSITLLSRVTAPVLASTRPWTVDPLLRVIEVWAIRLPSNAVVLPSVAELPICQ